MRLAKLGVIQIEEGSKALEKIKPYVRNANYLKAKQKLEVR